MTDQPNAQTVEKVVGQPQAEATQDNAVAQVSGDKVVDQTTPQVLVPETILKAEHDKLVKSMKDGHAGTTAQMRKEREALEAKIEELEDRVEEAGYGNWLKVLQDQGIENIDLAKQVVERDKFSRKETREIEKARKELSTLKAELDEAGKGKRALDIVKEFQLDEAVVTQLLGERMNGR